MAGCADNETAQHLFLSFPFFAALWGNIRSWLGVATTEPFGVSAHFYQFVYLTCGLRVCCSFMHLIWMCCVCVIWNERNSQVFKNKESNIYQLVEKFKLHSFWWIKPTNISIRPNFQMWWSRPFVCLGIG